jgi:hypothetical protein
MIFDFLSSLGKQETAFLIIALSVTVIMVAQYIFKDSDEFGQQTTSDLSPGELKQLVGQAVEEKVAPLQERIKELENLQARQLSRSEAPRSLSEPSPSTPPDDQS